MPKLVLTDLSVRALKPEARQLTYWDASLSGFGCRISPGGTKTFTLMYGTDRKRHTIGRYPTISLSDARSEAKRLLATRTLGQLSAPSISFSTAFSTYLETHCKTIRPRTAYDYERLLRRHFLGSFAKRPLSEISIRDITRIVDSISPGEGRHALVILKVFFSWAARRGYVNDSPCGKLRTPKQLARSKTLTASEFSQVLAYARSDPQGFNAIILLLIFTGQRRAEIGSLRWDWLDFGRQTLTLPSAITKNKREHMLPLGPLTISTIAAFPRSDDYVFPGRDDDGPFNGWSKCKARFDKNCGIAGWTLHDLRRTFATIHASIGTPPHIIERLLNHVSGTISGVAAIYNRWQYLEEMRVAAANYEQHLQRISGQV